MLINSIEELNFDNMSKEQAFLFGLLFNSISDKKIEAVDLLSREQIVKVCKDMGMQDRDIRFYCDFKYHNYKREDLASRFCYHIGSIYNKYYGLRMRIQKYLELNPNIMGL